jgi:uncharacterized protein YfaQ (DUF2300 family)
LWILVKHKFARHFSQNIESHHRVNTWEIIADNLSKAGWSWGCVSAVDSCGRTIWIADAHRDNGKRFVARADEKLSAFLELEAAIRGCGSFA